MKKTIKYSLFLGLLSISHYSLASEDYKLLYRSTQPQKGYDFTSIGLYPANNRFTVYYNTFSGTTTFRTMDGFDLDGKKVWELDASRWYGWGEKTVPHKNLQVLMDLSICPKSIKTEDCFFCCQEGYMFDISSGTVLYHSWKFARNFEIIFSTNSKYMLGQFGYGHSDEGGGDYSPSTGTCLIEVDTGKEIWCKEEVVSERNALMSQAGGIITGDKGIYDFYTGDRFLTFPQFAKKGDRVFEPQRSGADVVIRALSPDGRYFVATEGKCDPEINKWVLLMYGYCGLAHLTEMETYLGEWDRGVVKQKILRFEENVPSGVRYPFFFLPDGLLVVYSPYEQGVRLMNMKGETVSEIGNQKARGVGYYSLYRHEPEFYFDDKVVTWASAKENEWQVFDFTGKLIGEFAWKDPQGREFKIMGFKMINNREYIFTVDIYLKRNKNGGVIEYMTEVYRGKFGSEDGK